MIAVNSYVDDNMNDILLTGTMPAWVKVLLFHSDVFLICTISSFTFYGFWLLLNGGTQFVGDVILIILMDVILISLFIQIVRPSEIVLDINLAIVIVLYDLIFLFLLNGVGMRGLLGENIN
ncbi:MAG: hypothetical protein HeimC2_29450 [Candidatus Heimdallarchaeota archaeon LC_2]|nr:MAG: hypothetical protein HeimC2_29450 [Candidatus Heimdallarchaeota archaeon LC_2]